MVLAGNTDWRAIMWVLIILIMFAAAVGVVAFIHGAAADNSEADIRLVTLGQRFGRPQANEHRPHGA